MHKTFVQQATEQTFTCRELLDIIDDEIDSWHASKPDQALHEWLGFTQEQYKEFVSDPLMLAYILQRICEL